MSFYGRRRGDHNLILLGYQALSIQYTKDIVIRIEQFDK